MKKRSMLKTWFVLSISIIVIPGIVAVKAVEGEMPESGKESTMMDMHKCMMKCTMNCEKGIKGLSEAITLLEEAVTNVAAGNTADAKMNIEKAEIILKDMKAAQKECMEKMPTCNAQCPISGKAIDMMNTPQDLTRIYHDKKIGFCCPACPSQWDKLTDEEKKEKLEKVMPKLPEMSKEKELMKKMHDEMGMQKDNENTM